MIIRNVDGNDTVEFGDCALPVQKNSQSVTKAAGDCPGDDGEVGVIDNSTRTSIIQKLGLLKGSPEYGWLYGELNTEEIQQLNNLDLYLDANTTTEAIFFGLEAIRAFMAGGEVDFEEEIIYTSSVKECIKDVIKKMLGDNEYVDLGDMPDFVKQELNLSGYMLDIFNHSDKYNLIFDSKNLPPNDDGQRVNANTDPKHDPNDLKIINFTITLDSDYVRNATDLSVARTIIHESLHAYISYIYQDQMFDNLSNSLRTLLSVDGATDNSAQHILMTQEFVDAISNSLRSWDNNSLANHEYYNFLSWSGAMLNTPAFDDLDENKQQAIIDANIAEGSALSPATGLAQGTNNCN